MQETNFLSLHGTFFPKCPLSQSYREWDEVWRRKHISAVTLLTGFLYIIFALLDKPWIPKEFLDTVESLHLFTIAPFLMLISLLSYLQVSFRFVTLLLALSPVVANIIHLYLLHHIPTYSPLLPEVYLSVFWVFTMSGLAFGHAFISGSIIVIMVAYFSADVINDPASYTMHLFWLGCSLAFGLLGAFLVERSRRLLYLNHLSLEEMAQTDPLTQLYNRAKLFSVLPELIKQAHTPAIAIIDIDYFKSINDQYGHLQGDEVLQKIATILSDNTRDSDILIRWGGEEFLLLIAQHDTKGLQSLGDKLCHAVAAYPFEIGQQTVSIGLTMYTSAESESTFIKRADDALYIAKDKGRNCAIVI